jgi:hypothetical protein
MARFDEWFTPRRSGDTDRCVETLITDAAVYVRHSKVPDGPTLEFTHDEWRAFIASARESDDYTLPGQPS